MRRSLVLLFVCLALGAGGAAVYTVASPRQYSSTARIFLGAEDPSRSNGMVYVTIARADSYVSLVENTDVRERVADRVGGDIGSVDADVVEDTTLIDLTATDESPDRAAEVADAYAAVAAQVISDEERESVTFLVEVVDHARVPGRSDPRPMASNVGIGAGLGLAAGLLLATASGTRSALRRRPEA